MSGKSSIEWTDATWNPTRGCVKVSPSCKHCYAETFAERFRGVSGHPYERGFDPRLVPESLEAPLQWQNPRTIFVNSMSDLFLDDFGEDYVAEVFGVMAVAAHSFYGPSSSSRQNYGPHRFQVLTKRAARMRVVVSSARFREQVASAAYRRAHNRVDAGWLAQCVSGQREPGNMCTLNPMWPLPNVWLGVSVEDRKYGVPRIDELRATPAAVRFLSIEPLLEDLQDLDLAGIDWVVVGGESGHRARQCDVQWIRSIVGQCRAAGVPVFVKQLGSTIRVPDGEPLGDVESGWSPYARTCVSDDNLVRLSRKGGDINEWPHDLRVRQFPTGASNA